MSREEKIEYIRSCKVYSFAYLELDSFSDEELDQVIRRIAVQMQRQEVMISHNMVTDFAIFLN